MFTAKVTQQGLSALFSLLYVENILFFNLLSAELP